jgi:type I restriction-modification system DNA methylase subunit
VRRARDKNYYNIILTTGKLFRKTTEKAIISLLIKNNGVKINAS